MSKDLGILASSIEFLKTESESFDKGIWLVEWELAWWSLLKKNLFNDEMVICMGAGSISNWIREIGNELKWI